MLGLKQLGGWRRGRWYGRYRRLGEKPFDLSGLVPRIPALLPKQVVATQLSLGDEVLDLVSRKRPVPLAVAGVIVVRHVPVLIGPGIAWIRHVSTRWTLVITPSQAE